MATIRLKEIIETSGVERKEIARQLFPKNKFPDVALTRAVKGEGTLDADQISKLSLITGIPISELFSGQKWKTVFKEGIHTFTNGDFKAELDTRTWTTKLFCNGSLFHETVICSGSIPLSEYLSKLDSLIINHLKN